jgi:hypothetical protein
MRANIAGALGYLRMKRIAYFVAQGGLVAYLIKHAIET